MTADARESYLESEVSQAGGCRLIALLYAKALEDLTEARRCVAEGRIDERSRAITRAGEILNELALALDHDSGGEMSRNLVEIYDYIQHRLQEANFQQIEPPLAEAENLLKTLQEGWGQCLSREIPAGVIAVDSERAPVDCTR